MSRGRCAPRRIALIVAGALSVIACATEGTGVRWPATFGPGEAVLFSHNEVVIAASCARVWSILIKASAWPAWYSNAHEVTVGGDKGDLEAASHFNWTTFGIRVQSQVRELEPGRRLAWLGRAPGITAYHAWSLHPLANGCHVVTDETNNGPAAVALRREKPEAIHDGHAQWLTQLKSRSEHAEEMQTAGQRQ